MAPATSSCRKISENDGISKLIICWILDGSGACPVHMASTVVTNIPRSIAPFIFRAINTPVTSIPTKDNAVLNDNILPKVTRVATLPTTIPAFCKPMKAMNAPIPHPIEQRKHSGMAAMIACRKRVTVSIKNATPETKTAPNAVCHGNPMPRQTVYVKNADIPIPGASAMGKLTHNPISSVVNADVQITAETTASRGIPVSASMEGTTKIT